MKQRCNEWERGGRNRWPWLICLLAYITQPMDAPRHPLAWYEGIRADNELGWVGLIVVELELGTQWERVEESLVERVHCHLVDLVKLAGRSGAVVPGRHGRLGKAWEGLDAERPGLREGPKVCVMALGGTAGSGAVAVAVAVWR